LSDKINNRLAVILLIVLLLVAGYSFLGADREPSMELYTVAYTDKQAGTVYTLYDKKGDLKITTPDYELAADPAVPIRAYLSAPIICSISRMDPKTTIADKTADSQNRPKKMYHGMKATYKTDGAVYMIYLENGEVYEGCDVGKWNHSRLGQPKYID
jgi:hypothetical protein